ncbi:unnamed protein product [Enterobius vermicularis]|uniref:Malate dehydrogenase n=1 Tax=Enterobius vermicularis TaxID=51028 RepID=A0A158Q9U8_ENTVE|nr:unnamed protein product [Enterobius vermicularis]
MSASNALVFSFKTLFVPRCLSVGSVNRTLAAYRRQYHTLKTGPEPGDKIVEIAEVKRFMVDVMTAVETDKAHSEQLADVLAEADMRGHYSHGLNRLDMYMRDIKEKACKNSGKPEVLCERAATAWVNGNNLLGPVVGNFCIDLAIQKAKQSGIGWVVANRSNHFGIAAYYSMKAAREGCLGLAFTNTSPIMYPTRASTPALGTNPLTLAAEGLNGDSFVLDMATTTVAIGKVEIANRKETSVPNSWGVAAGGKVTTDTSKILHGGGLLPLGGSEESGGYKGYGLGALVEIFCGILSGSHWGPNVRKWLSTSAAADLGQCFAAIDPDAFAPDFRKRMQQFIDTMRGLMPAGEENVLVAGDPEREHIKMVHENGGIPYHPNQIKFADNLSSKLGIETMKVKRTV